MKTFYAESLSVWHNWLIENSRAETEIWLLFYKKGSGKPCISYEDSIEEALCFGWVDSLIRNLDAESHVRKFTPRNPGSKWSQVNIARAEKLISQGRMTEAGRILFEVSRGKLALSGVDRKAEQEEFRAALLERLEPADLELFLVLPPSLQRQYAGWVMSAAREETRVKRLAEVLDALRRGERLGLK